MSINHIKQAQHFLRWEKTIFPRITGQAYKESAHQKGSVVVEFALIFPLLLFIVFSIIECSLALYDKAVITNASREAARAGSARARQVAAHDVCGNHAYLQPHAQHRFTRHGRGRDDAEPVAVRNPRGLPQLLRACLRRAHAFGLVPPRRRPSGRAAEAA